MRSRLLAAAAFAAATALGSSAHAQSIIKNPGDHPDYKVEVEPHLNFGWASRWASNGVGVGGRFSIPVVKNGFVPTINNSVAISFGLDYLRYGGCYGNGAIFKSSDCGGASFLLLPVAMQWNFWLSPTWSVFGEPGLYIYHGIYDDPCAGLGAICATPSRTSVDFLFHAGGRFHFNDTVALTMRVGYPTLSVGVSFLF
jgi:hypothetical protein